MCVGTVGRVTERRGATATVMVGNRTQSVNAGLRPEAKAGDFVLIQTGLILDIITEAEALEIERFDREMETLLDQDTAPPRSPYHT